MMKTSLSRTLNRFMPPNRTYLGYSRQVILALFSAALVVLLIIAIGLGLGLRKGSQYVVNLQEKRARKCLTMQRSRFTSSFQYQDFLWGFNLLCSRSWGMRIYFFR
jgi:hypothetical protein